MARAYEDLDHIREVVFASWIVGAQFVHVFPERIGLEAIDTHVGLANGQLFRCAGLLLDDGAHRARGIANYAAVAGRVFEFGGDESRGGARTILMIHQCCEQRRRNQRAISVVHHQHPANMLQ